MFSELPSIFDRNFVISFFLPVLLFIVVSLGLFYGFGFTIQITSDSSPLQFTTLLGVGSLLGGIILLVLNFEIYRALEGYPVEKVKLFTAVEKRRYRKLWKELSALNQERALYQTADDMPPKRYDRRQELMEEAVVRFPDREEFVLPTSLGNIIRAFEVYSKVIYGIDAIPGWARLQAVISKDFQGILGESKAITDFWVNMLVLSFIFLLEYVGLAIYSGRVIKIWVPILSVGLALLFYSRAKYAAKLWGETVRAAFDVFLPDLRKKLNFPFPTSMDDEREQWLLFSRVMIFQNTKIELNRVETSAAPSNGEAGSQES